MTICLALHFGEYAMLCADTRTTSQSGADLWYDDSSNKVYETDIGLMTGAGWTEMLDPVKRRFESHEVQQVGDVRRIVDEERERLRTTAYVQSNESEVEQWISTTGWFFTYCTIIDAAPRIRLGMIHPAVDSALPNPENVFCVDEQQARMIAPARATADEAEAFLEVLQGKMRRVDEFANVQEHFAYHRAVCGALVLLAAEKFPDVSSFMNAGIHTINGQVDVSERIDLRSDESGDPDSGRDNLE